MTTVQSWGVVRQHLVEPGRLRLEVPVAVESDEADALVVVVVGGLVGGAVVREREIHPEVAHAGVAVGLVIARDRHDEPVRGVGPEAGEPVIPLHLDRRPVDHVAGVDRQAGLGNGLEPGVDDRRPGVAQTLLSVAEVEEVEVGRAGGGGGEGVPVPGPAVRAGRRLLVEVVPRDPVPVCGRGLQAGERGVPRVLDEVEAVAFRGDRIDGAVRVFDLDRVTGSGRGGEVDRDRGVGGCGRVDDESTDVELGIGEDLRLGRRAGRTGIGAPERCGGKRGEDEGGDQY